LIKVIVGLQRD